MQGCAWKCRDVQSNRARRGARFDLLTLVNQVFFRAREKEKIFAEGEIGCQSDNEQHRANYWHIRDCPNVHSRKVVQI